MESNQSGNFGLENVNNILQSPDSLSAAQINGFFQGKKRSEKSIHLPSMNKKVLVHRWEKGHQDILVYSVEDGTKIVVIGFTKIDSDDIYILRDKLYKHLIVALIGHEDFVLTQLNSQAPPLLPTVLE
jgi:hypothetical protein